VCMRARCGSELGMGALKLPSLVHPEKKKKNRPLPSPTSPSLSPCALPLLPLCHWLSSPDRHLNQSLSCLACLCSSPSLGPPSPSACARCAPLGSLSMQAPCATLGTTTLLCLFFNASDPGFPAPEPRLELPAGAFPCPVGPFPCAAVDFPCAVKAFPCAADFFTCAAALGPLCSLSACLPVA